VTPIPVPAEAPQKLALRLVPDAHPRPTRAVAARFEHWAEWAERMPSFALRKLHGVRCGSRLLVLGNALPSLPNDERYWGREVLSPLGFRPEPLVADAELRRAAGATEDDVLILRHDGAETIAAELFAPLSLAALRLALAEAPA
jgi:hypothetical protein